MCSVGRICQLTYLSQVSHMAIEFHGPDKNTRPFFRLRRKRKRFHIYALLVVAGFYLAEICRRLVIYGADILGGAGLGGTLRRLFPYLTAQSFADRVSGECVAPWGTQVAFSCSRLQINNINFAPAAWCMPNNRRKRFQVPA